MLVEHGFVRAQLPDGREWTFTPSFGRIAELGDPFEIVRLFGELHGPTPEQAARHILRGLCDPDSDDIGDALGWVHGAVIPRPEGWQAGAIPIEDQVILARHLMQHGVCGKPQPGAQANGDAGKYSDRFDAGEFIAMARAHLGMSAADAAALSMTELQQLMAAKFPDSKAKSKNVPSRAEYEAAMTRLKERREGAPA